MLRLAIADLASWVVPLLALIPITRIAGCADRFVPLVVSSNWGVALINWMFVPAFVVTEWLPLPMGIGALLALLLITAYLVLTWRLYKTVIGGSTSQALGVFGALLLVELMVAAFARQTVGLPLFQGA